MGAPDLDRQMMARALELARRGEGATRPNPPVGAVVVREGRIVGEGYHKLAGTPHAEVHALRAAGDAAHGSTLYVTLEPCSSHGRTPPCCAAILEAGVARVVVAVRDPDPRHCGRGLRLLRRAGVDVDVGVCCAEAAELLAPFRSRVERSRPWLTLKMAMTTGGRIADVRGGSRWITGPESRARVQRLRRASDAVLVGRGTVEADDPGLLPARPGRLRPYRVVLDSAGALSPDARVVSDTHAECTLIYTTAAASDTWRAAVSAGGATVVVVPARRGRVSLRHMLRDLGRRGVMRVLCEGGGELAGALVEQGLVDDFYLFVAPKLLLDGAPVFSGVGRRIGAPLEVSFTSVELCGADCLIRAVPVRERE
jgi:diaminohydroxyphosphoribosylaminopyrimidine deaminase/5-amino-6-(5-phosphoribosylamino)uracil reductase